MTSGMSYNFEAEVGGWRDGELVGEVNRGGVHNDEREKYEGKHNNQIGLYR